MLDRIAPMMRGGGTVLVSLANRRNGGPTQEFQRLIGHHASRLLRPYACSPVFSFVTASRSREWMMRWMIRLAKLARDRPFTGVPAVLIFGLPLTAACWITNGMTTILTGVPPKSRVSSVLMRITIDADRAREAYQYSSSRILRDRKLARVGLPKGHRLPPRNDVGKAPVLDYLLTGRDRPASRRLSDDTVIEQQAYGFDMDRASRPSDGTREPQYNRCIEIKESQGLTSLGLMTNQVWEDDPRRLTILLSRYKFVAKMLSGKKNVGELGCGDAFGTRIVMQEVPKVMAYDFDPAFIEDIKERRSKTWPVEVKYQDILEKPLPERHDGIYSLDVIEHIPPEEEHKYVGNLRSSLTDDGVLIVGTPSLEYRLTRRRQARRGTSIARAVRN